MATQITATTPLSRPAPRLGGREVGILAVIAVAVISVGAWTQAGSIRDVTIGGQAYDAGYPLHGGLAGPSGVGQVSTLAGPSRAMSAVNLAGQYGPDYPPHGGLAGPSRAMSAVNLAGQYGPDYPLHGGLAGPNRVDSAD